jgi:hypothetical protein
MEALIGIIGGIVGAVLGAWCAVAFPRIASRRQAALQLLDRYTSPEFFVARAETWRIRYAWPTDRSCVDFFIRSPDRPHHPDTETRCSNGLTPHQNLSWLLHFFTSVQLHYQAGLVDARMVKVLFEPHYHWYEQFFHEFCEEYRSKSSPGQPEPAWLSALPKLEELFHKTPALNNPRWRTWSR